jgi:hypothetical protein
MRSIKEENEGQKNKINMVRQKARKGSKGPVEGNVIGSYRGNTKETKGEMKVIMAIE